MSEEIVLRKLTGDLAYMFTQPSCYSFHRGWITPLDRMCRSIDSMIGVEKCRFHWVRIKEKFGSARYDFHLKKLENISDSRKVEGKDSTLSLLDNEHLATWKQIRAMVRSAQAETAERCIACGMPGTIQQKGRRFSCLCDVHHRVPMEELHKIIEIENTDLERIRKLTGWYP